MSAGGRGRCHGIRTELDQMCFGGTLEHGGEGSDSHYISVHTFLTSTFPYVALDRDVRFPAGTTRRALRQSSQFRTVFRLDSGKAQDLNLIENTFCLTGPAKDEATAHQSSHCNITSSRLIRTNSNRNP